MTYIQRSGNKYHAKSTEYGGVVYHSKLEAAYAEELDWRVHAKDIKSWDRQVKLPLKVNGMLIANYYLDFIVTHNNGTKEFVEVKGHETEVWKMKWKILEATFEEFKESPDDFLTVIKQTGVGFRSRR